MPYAAKYNNNKLFRSKIRLMGNYKCAESLYVVSIPSKKNNNCDLNACGKIIFCGYWQLCGTRLSPNTKHADL